MTWPSGAMAWTGQPLAYVTSSDGIIVIDTGDNKVVDEILAFREQVGDFGTLLYAGKDWLDREHGRRSMILMAEKVLPAINAAIGA